MDYQKLFQALPDLISLFVPGFIFISILRYFKDNESVDFEHTAVTSVLLSYIFNIISEFICKKNNDFLSIIIAVISAFAIVILKQTDLFTKILIKTRRITGHESIWYDIFKINSGTKVRFYTLFNHEKVMIEGNIKYYDVKTDCCEFALEMYKITYPNGNIYDTSIDELKGEHFLYINSKDIHGLETSYDI